MITSDPESTLHGDIFAHFSETEGSGYRTLKEGQVVTFLFGMGPKGPQAVDVE